MVSQRSCLIYTSSFLAYKYCMWACSNIWASRAQSLAWLTRTLCVRLHLSSLYRYLKYSLQTALLQELPSLPRLHTLDCVIDYPHSFNLQRRRRFAKGDAELLAAASSSLTTIFINFDDSTFNQIPPSFGSPGSDLERHQVYMKFDVHRSDQGMILLEVSRSILPEYVYKCSIKQISVGIDARRATQLSICARLCLSTR